MICSTRCHPGVMGAQGTQRKVPSLGDAQVTSLTPQSKHWRFAGWRFSVASSAFSLGGAYFGISTFICRWLVVYICVCVYVYVMFYSLVSCQMRTKPCKIYIILYIILWFPWDWAIGFGTHPIFCCKAIAQITHDSWKKHLALATFIGFFRTFWS